MIDAQANPARKFTVQLPDGRTFGPADAVLLSQWARDGRIPASAQIQPSDGSPAVRAADLPELGPYFSTPPTVQGPIMAPPAADEGVSYLIPYRNLWALASYYLGVFALIPIIGLLLGLLAIVFGVLGIRHAAKHANAHGRVHAAVGIVLGVFVLVGHVVVFVLLRRM